MSTNTENPPGYLLAAVELVAQDMRARNRMDTRTREQKLADEALQLGVTPEVLERCYQRVAARLAKGEYGRVE